MAVGCKCKSHCMFRNCFRRISRNTENLHAVFVSCFQVYIVITCAAHKDQFDTLFIQLFDYLSTQICINERTDCLIASGKGSGLFVNVGFCKFDLYTRIRGKKLFEKFLVVVFCAVK